MELSKSKVGEMYGYNPKGCRKKENCCNLEVTAMSIFIIKGAVEDNNHYISRFDLGLCYKGLGKQLYPFHLCPFILMK